MTLVPFGDHIIAKRVEARETTASGLVIPASAKQDASYNVIAVGPGRVPEAGGIVPMATKVGDVVMLRNNPYAVQEVDLAGEKVCVFHETDVLGVVG